MANSKEAPHVDFVHGTRSIPDGESFTIVDYVEAVANIAALTKLGLNPETEGVIPCDHGERYRITEQAKIDPDTWLEYLS